MDDDIDLTRSRERFERDFEQISILRDLRVRALEEMGVTVADLNQSPDPVLSALTSAFVCMKLERMRWSREPESSAPPDASKVD